MTETSNSPHITIVIPVYNEQAILHAAIVDLRERLAPLGWTYEIVIAENGSTDRTVSIARELALRGRKVVVLERDRVGAHASTAAAGILTSRGSRESGRSGRNFYLRSLQAYPEWIGTLASESGGTLALEEGDDWCVFPSGGGADRFRSTLETESVTGSWREVEALPSEMGAPFSPRSMRAFRIRGERWIDPKLLFHALLESALRLGVQVVEGCGPVGIDRDGGGWRLETPSRRYLVPLLVVSAGPWTSDLLRPLGWSTTCIPVRGQLALVPALHPVAAMVHIEDMCYVVPRRGWSVVGATMEHGSRVEEVTRSGLKDLAERISWLFPHLDLARASRTWSGIRPRSRDRNPHLGWLEPGLFLASGHFRSGISMAPRTGMVAASMIEGAAAPEDAIALAPLRPGGWRQR